MEKVKQYCYDGGCDIVQTGFHLEQYFVCKKCKKEITPALKTQIDDRAKNKEVKEEHEDLFGGFGITPDDFFDGT